MQVGEISSSKHVLGVISIVDKNTSIFYIRGRRLDKIYKMICGAIIFMVEKKYCNHCAVLMHNNRSVNMYMH